MSTIKERQNSGGALLLRSLLAARRFAVFNPITTTIFLPVIDENACTDRGKCAEACPIEVARLFLDQTDESYQGLPRSGLVLRSIIDR